MHSEWVLVFDDVAEASKNFPINSTKTIRIDKHTICLSRLIDGFFAIHDSCPHEKVSLSNGKCSANGMIECPWHHYLFDIRSGKNIGNTCGNVATYEVKTENNQLFIQILTP